MVARAKPIYEWRLIASFDIWLIWSLPALVDSTSKLFLLLDQSGGAARARAV